MKLALSFLAIALSVCSAQATILCADKTKKIEITISNLDFTVDSPSKISVEMTRNGIAKNLLDHKQSIQVIPIKHLPQEKFSRHTT